MKATTQPEQSLWPRSDVQCRSWSARLSRFLRARFSEVCSRGLKWADEPRVMAAWRHGWDADHYVRLLRWRDEGFYPRVVYDVGAHAGSWSGMCQAVFSPTECVLFEPQREYLEQARARHCRQGGNWRLVQLALGDSEQSHPLHLTQNRAAASILTPLTAGDLTAQTRVIAQETVRLMPLDAVVEKEKLPAPDLIKIDVQGFESKVLTGGAATLRKTQRIVIETSLRPIYEGQSLLPDILRTLTSEGFHLDDMSEVCRTWPAGRLWQADLWLRRVEPPT